MVTRLPKCSNWMQYPHWREALEEISKRQGIWEHIDLESAIELPQPSGSTASAQSSVDGESMAQPSNDGRVQLQNARRQYDRMERAFGFSLTKKIKNSFIGHTSLRGKLEALDFGYRMFRVAERRRLEAEYQFLKKPPSNVNAGGYFGRWLALGEIQKHANLTVFITGESHAAMALRDAMSAHFEMLAIAREAFVLSMAGNEVTLLDEIRFWNLYVQERKMWTNFPVISQGEDTRPVAGVAAAQVVSDESSSEQEYRMPTPKCVCGQVHWYKDCRYLNPSAPRHPNWKPKWAVEEKIERRLENDDKFREDVGRALRRC